MGLCLGLGLVPVFVFLLGLAPRDGDDSSDNGNDDNNGVGILNAKCSRAAIECRSNECGGDGNGDGDDGYGCVLR
jgi:hypothetical protein